MRARQAPLPKYRASDVTACHASNQYDIARTFQFGVYPPKVIGKWPQTISMTTQEMTMPGSRHDFSMIPVIDHHCHNWARQAAPFSAEEYRLFFTEALDRRV